MQRGTGIHCVGYILNRIRQVALCKPSSEDLLPTNLNQECVALLPFFTSYNPLHPHPTHLTSIINLRSPPTVYHFRMNSSCLVPLPAPWRHRNKCVSFFCFYKTGNNLVHLLKVCFPHPPSPHVFCVYVRASIQSACRRTPLPPYSYNLFIFRLRSTISFWR